MMDYVDAGVILIGAIAMTFVGWVALRYMRDVTNLRVRNRMLQMAVEKSKQPRDGRGRFRKTAGTNLRNPDITVSMESYLESLDRATEKRLSNG